MTRAVRSLPPAALLLFALACSEGPGVIPQGGAHFTTSSSSSAPADTSCPTPGYTVAIGDPAPDLNSDVSGKTLPDGVNGADVSCTVKGRDRVTFSGSLLGRNTNDERQAEIRFTNGVIEDGGTGTVNVSLTTPISTSTVGSLTLESESPCTITGVTNSDGDQFGDGVLWGRFNCNAMVTSRQPSTFCRTTGVVVFENCNR